MKLGIRTHVGKELVLDMRSEGEVFGLLSLMGRDVARLDVVALEDTLCYSIPAEVRAGPDRPPPRSRRLPVPHLDHALHGPQPHRVAHPGQPDGQRRATSVLARGRAMWRGMERWYARRRRPFAMRRRSSRQGNPAPLFVVDAEGRAIGAVTDRDFAKKVVAGGVAADLPVTKIMTTPVIAVESSERIFQALLIDAGPQHSPHPGDGTRASPRAC